MEKPTYEQLEAQLAKLENSADRDSMNEIMPRQYAIEDGDTRFWYDQYQTMNGHFYNTLFTLRDNLGIETGLSLVDTLKVVKAEHDELVALRAQKKA